MLSSSFSPNNLELITEHLFVPHHVNLSWATFTIFTALSTSFISRIFRRKKSNRSTSKEGSVDQKVKTKHNLCELKHILLYIYSKSYYGFLYYRSELCVQSIAITHDTTGRIFFAALEKSPHNTQLHFIFVTTNPYNHHVVLQQCCIIQYSCCRPRAILSLLLTSVKHVQRYISH